MTDAALVIFSHNRGDYEENEHARYFSIWVFVKGNERASGQSRTAAGGFLGKYLRSLGKQAVLGISIPFGYRSVKLGLFVRTTRSRKEKGGCDRNLLCERINKNGWKNIEFMESAECD
jgi:hypothetical protein